MLTSCRRYWPADYYLCLAGVFNDIAVASAVCLRDYPAKCNLQTPILVVDLDVHQVVTYTQIEVLKSHHRCGVLIFTVRDLKMIRNCNYYKVAEFGNL